MLTTIDRPIIIFGLTGSGKSTLADALGAYFGLRVIHPSSILRALLENRTPDMKQTTPNTGFWESIEGIALFQDRLAAEEPLDLVCDKLLINELRKETMVMDSWSMPWLYKNATKIYLRADLKIRAKRIAVSRGYSYIHAINTAHMKDNETRRLYLRTRGFDITHHLQVFDLIIDTDTLSFEEVVRRTIIFFNGTST